MKVVAAFDFDGTITARDSLIPFLVFLFGFLKTARGLLLLFPDMLRFLFGKVSRREIKEKILTSFLKGLQRDRLESMSEKFAESRLNRIVRRKALRRIRWHQEQGHVCVVVSASIDLYIIPWARKMGMEAIASELELDSKGCITGKLRGENCRGKEKVCRLQERFGDKSGFYLYAYGDSAGDKELLKLADSPYFRVF